MPLSAIQILVDSAMNRALNFLSPDVDTGTDAGSDELDGVVQEVAEALGEKRLIAQHGQFPKFERNVSGTRLEVGIGLDHPAQQSAPISTGVSDNSSPAIRL